MTTEKIDEINKNPNCKYCNFCKHFRTPEQLGLALIPDETIPEYLCIGICDIRYNNGVYLFTNSRQKKFYTPACSKFELRWAPLYPIYLDEISQFVMSRNQRKLDNIIFNRFY